MRKKKQNRAILRFGLLIIAFLLVIAAIFLLSRHLAPEESTSGNSVTGTDTAVGGTSSDIPNPQTDTDPQTIRALAASLYAEESFEAQHMAVYDLTAGVMLYEKDAQTRITAASTTKLLTALTALDHVDENTVFTVGSELSLVGSGSSTANLKKGQQLTVEQVLDALLIPSGNDAAYVIAAHVGRNLAKDPDITDKDAVSVFLERMNDKGKSLGVKDSLFTCPDGYPDKKQYTTAADMMCIAIAAAQNETILETVSKTYAAHTLSDGTLLEFTNTNQILLPSSGYFYEGTFGLKTGSTPAAGQCVIAGASAYGHDILVALFKAPDNNARWTDCRLALDVATEAVRQAQEKKLSS